MRHALLLISLLVPSIASAHISLTYPPPRSADQKAQVCGAVNSMRGTNITTLAPGATIMVMWKETIDHPGHYRISFDDDGQDFIIPLSEATNTEGMPNVIDDMIADIQGNLPAGGRVYMQQITLPNIECSNCTLQVTQLMTDKLPYSADATSDDIYYQCADIQLSNAPAGGDAGIDPMPEAGVDPGPSNTSGGCATTRDGCLPVGLAMLGIVFLRRRRLQIRAL